MADASIRSTADATTPRSAVGALCAVAAFGWWGLVPVYFKAVAHVPALQVLSHRVVWSVVLLIGLVLAQARWRDLARVLRRGRTRWVLLATSVLIALNWFVFIWAVEHDRVLEASLGYFINPLVSVVLGVVFLHERLRRWQLVAVAVATAGVVFMTFDALPGLGLILAGSFGLYGLLRKVAPVDAVLGLTVETMLLLPAAGAYLVYVELQGSGALGHVSRATDGLLVLAGVITAVPLLWFAMAARRLRLVTVGLLQYIAPTGQFLLGVLAYHEPFDQRRAVSFGVIWLALLIYSADAVRAERSARAAARGMPMG